jgi:hypothetical protein
VYVQFCVLQSLLVIYGITQQGEKHGNSVNWRRCNRLSRSLDRQPNQSTTGGAESRAATTQQVLDEANRSRLDLMQMIGDVY